MNEIKADWVEFCIDRLARLCRLRRYCDGYADANAKMALQRAVFSVYLDCRKADATSRAEEVLRGQVPETRELPDPAGARAP